jgi:UDP:flavonoid glycosyltransferase YjiC (YdhE family)
MEPSAAYPPMATKLASLGGAGNRVAGNLTQLMPASYDTACAQVRRELGLAAKSRRAAERRRREDQPVHHGISPVVLPRPRDWRPGLYLDGYWWPPQPPGWTPPGDLVGFLGSGPAPVIITFGSTPASQAASRAAVTAARQAGQRVIIQDPATDEPSGDGGVLRSGPIPHAWLFLQAAAVVHHAGAGTTAAGLRAGIPAVTVPAYTDQPFWASRLSALGAGPAPVPRRRMTTGRLTAAIAAVVHTPDYLRNARQIAGQLTREDSATGILSDLEHTGKIP